MATILFLIFSGLFTLKQYQAKRPHFHFEVLYRKNIMVGLLLFFFFYVIRSGVNNVYTVVTSVWGWPWEYIVDVQYFNVSGTLLGIAISGILLVKEVRSTIILGLGFLMLAIDCAWFTTVFYPDTTLLKVGLPLALQGFAQGWLFTPLVMFLITGLPAKWVGNGSLLGTSVRFWGTNIGFAIIQNFTQLLNKKHYSVLQQALDTSNPVAQGSWNAIMQQFTLQFDQQVANMLTTSKLNGIVSKQALLLSKMEIFTGLMWLSVVTCLVIFLQRPARIVIRKLGIKNTFFAG